MNLLDLVRDDAEAIEHAIHTGLLPDPACPLMELAGIVAAVRDQARLTPGGIPALCAADYCDEPALFPRRMNEALHRAALFNDLDDHQYVALFSARAA